MAGSPVRGRWGRLSRWCVEGAGDGSGHPGGPRAAGEMPHPCSSETKSKQELTSWAPLPKRCCPKGAAGSLLHLPLELYEGAGRLTAAPCPISSFLSFSSARGLSCGPNALSLTPCPHPRWVPWSYLSLSSPPKAERPPTRAGAPSSPVGTWRRASQAARSSTPGQSCLPPRCCSCRSAPQSCPPVCSGARRAPSPPQPTRGLGVPEASRGRAQMTLSVLPLPGLSSLLSISPFPQGGYTRRERGQTQCVRGTAPMKGCP